MIALVRGEVAVRRPDHVVVDVGGRRLPPRGLGRDAAPRPGGRARTSSLHTHLIVRDDALQLYGFATEEERELFLLLLGVQSVGPKMALGVLSGGPPRELIARARRRRHRALPGRARASASARPSGSSSSCARRSTPTPIVITRGAATTRAALARDGLLELGFAAGRGRDAAAGRRRRAPPRSSSASALQAGPRDEPHPDPRPRRRRGGARALAAPARPRRVRRPGRAQGAARASRSRPPRRAARRSTTCCSPARPGLGKTSLAQILAAELDVPFVQTAGPALERKGDIAAFLTALEPRSVFFVDELHRLSRALEETFYPAMEDRKLPITVGQGAGARVVTLDLPPFTLVGATTRAGLLSTPLRDRFGIQHRLEPYGADDLAAIVRRSARILDVELDAAGARAIAARSRGHAARRQPAAQARARLRRGPHGRRRHRRGGRPRARAARGRRARPRPPRPRDPRARSASASTAARSACRRSPSRWGRSRTRSRTSTSPTCSSRASSSARRAGAWRRRRRSATSASSRRRCFSAASPRADYPPDPQHGPSLHLPQLRQPHDRDRPQRRLPPAGQGLLELRLRLPLRAARRLLPGAERRVLRHRPAGPRHRLRPRLVRADRPRRRAASSAARPARSSACSFADGSDHVATVLEWGVRQLDKPVEVNAEGDLPAKATADLFPAYDDDGGMLLVLTPTS